MIAVVLGGTLAVAARVSSDVESASFPAGLPGCPEKRPCVLVLPDPVFTRSGSFLYAGQGWQPGTVRISYRDDCGPECDSGTVRAEATVDDRGRFAFTLPEDAGAGGGEGSVPTSVRAEQRRDGKVDRRKAEPVPARASARRRREARSLARAVGRAHRAIARRRDVAFRVSQKRFRRFGQCSPPQDDAYATEARGAVTDGLSALTVDDATYTAVDPQLRAYARDLRRLRLRDPELRAAADAWRELIAGRERWTLKRACTALRRWDRSGYAPDRRPIDPATVRSFELLATENRALDLGGARLRALGAELAPAKRFAGGLVDRVGS